MMRLTSHNPNSHPYLFPSFQPLFSRPLSRRSMLLVPLLGLGVVGCDLFHSTGLQAPSAPTATPTIQPQSPVTVIDFPSKAIAAYDIGWSPDLQYAAVQQQNAQTVQIWEIKTQKVISSFNYPSLARFQSTAPNSWYPCWSANNRWLALPDETQKNPLRLDIYDLHMGQRVSSIIFSLVVGLAAWSPDSKWIIAGFGNTYEVWDVAARKKLVTYVMPDVAGVETTAIAWSPDNQQIAFLFESKDPLNQPHHPFIRLWNVRTNRHQDISFASSSSLSLEFLSWSPSGTHLAALFDNYLRVIEVASSKVLFTTPAKYTLAWSPDSRHIAFPSSEKYGHTIVQVWDIAQHKQVRTYGSPPLDPDQILMVAWSVDGTLIRGTGVPSRMLLWRWT